jgi:hypothetical protein
VSAPTAFYCVSSPEYFLGAVAMINSLRLQGHAEPVYLLDAGLSDDQRELVAAEATVLRAPGDAEPFMLKTVAPMAHPAEVMVLIDVDMIVTRPLGELIERAREGAVVAPALTMTRHFPEWGPMLGRKAAGELPYVTSGLVLLGGPVGLDVLSRMDAAVEGIDLARTFAGGADTGYPFHYADQDLLNAVLATAGDPERVEVLEPRLVAATPFDGVEIVDAHSARCAYADGVEPYVLHHVFGVKPWAAATPDGVFPQLLRRLLVAEDLPLRPSRRALPRHLRPGPLGALERVRVRRE